MSKSIPLFILALMLWLTTTVAHTANVKAWLDRPVIEWGETVTLNIESDDTSGGQPDLSVLRGDFDIVQQSSSSQTTTNTSTSTRKSSSTTIWAVAIKAKAPGIFTIPAISIQGKQTEPLTLRVNQPKPESQDEAAHAGEDIFLLASVDDDQPYVQQNVLYTIKLYHKINIYNPKVSLPSNKPSIIMQEVGKGLQYTTQVGNDIYRVIERRFAFQFSQSGAHTLAPSVLEGQMVSNRADMFGRPYGGKQFTKHSPSVTLNVRPIPVAAKQPFLPATSMQLLLDSGTMPTSVTVGEPLSINLRLRAEGLSADQLPTLTLPNMAQASVYPDKPIRQDLKANDRLASRISRGFAIVPSQAGTLVIPPVRIAWWNTATNQAETASWPGASIRVLPADQTASGNSSATNNPSASNASATQTTTDGALIASNMPNNEASKSTWKYLAFAGFALWLVTLLLWWRQTARAKRQANINRPIQPKAARSDLKELNRLLRDNPSPAAITQALIRLANQHKNGALSLQDVCNSLSNTEQQAAIRALDRHRFAANIHPSDWSDTLDVIRQAFAKPPEWRSEENAADNTLPELYPSK